VKEGSVAQTSEVTKTEFVLYFVSALNVTPVDFFLFHNDNNDNFCGKIQQDVQILLNQNERLKEALLKLKDISVLEKQQQELKIRELQKQIEIIPELEGDLQNSLCVIFCFFFSLFLFLFLFLSFFLSLFLSFSLSL
jgi:hypothetical protein